MKFNPKRIGVGAVLASLAIQLIPAGRTNPEQRETPHAPPEVVALLQRACYDCHSNATTWPWYTKVAPFSWLAVHDVEEAREHVNFSEWSKYSPEDQEHIREEVWEEVEEGEMPLWYYTPLHAEAQLSSEEMDLLRAWAGEEDN
jgi:hypothetical protein